uniref:F-actin-capping protein subunit beta n=1 Tax=Blastobotrys adeninivorans TaxID=409370 RepID=A0A060TE91_BLAAD
MEDPLDAALDLLRRLDPKDIATNINALCRIAPSLAEDLLASVDQPLGVKTCPDENKTYLTCDYNRDGDSYRSPWSGKYNPPISGAPEPSEKLRKLEIVANDAFDVYRELYYEGGMSSVYLWDEDNGFAGVVLLKKGAEKTAHEGTWDAIHVFEVDTTSRKTATYRFTSTVILDLRSASANLGNLNLTGSLTRQTERTLPITDESSQVVNIGTIVEEVESKLRNLLNDVYFGKTRDIVGDLRTVATTSELYGERQLQGEVARGLGA